MFDSNALWAVKYAVGDINLPTKEEMKRDSAKWVARWVIEIHTTNNFVYKMLYYFEICAQNKRGNY